MKFFFDEGGQNSNVRKVIYGVDKYMGEVGTPSPLLTTIEKFARDFKAAEDLIHETADANREEISKKEASDIEALILVWADKIKVSV